MTTSGASRSSHDPGPHPGPQHGPDAGAERARWSQVRALFEEALDLQPDARADFLAKASGPDARLRGEVERLLALHDEDVWEQTASTQPRAARPPRSAELLAALSAGAPLQPGAMVGTWRLLRRLGAGGMGEVWEAEQERPRRHAALKVVRAGLPGTRARQRFRDEIDTLARLEHPGIARILEAGEHAEPDGEVRPWYAMELVAGARTLTAWAAARHLPWRKRVAVLRRVCEAVDHGHRNGVIHRDLKPSNILVGEDGQPRVIDFGVARVTAAAGVAVSASGGEVRALARHTQAGELVGTLATMAPEQLDGHADVRSDVYALGMVLHELLAGEPPYDVEGLSLAEAARVVREEAPPPPGDAVPELPLDVDWVVGRALEKDPELRYPSVSALSEDLRRLLADEPVDAGPPSRTYRLKKFAKRHRVGVAVGGVIALLLVAGITGTTIGMVRASRAATDALESGQAAEAARAMEAAARKQESLARARAEDAAAEANAVTGFLTDVFGAANPDRDGNEARVVDALQRADERMAGFLKGHPHAERTLRAALGRLDVQLGRYEEGERNIVRALELPASVEEAADPDATLVESSLRLRLAEARQGLGRLDDAEADVQAAIDMRTAKYGERHASLAEPLSALASLRNRQGRAEDAEAVFHQALEIARDAQGSDHVDVARLQCNLGNLQMEQRRFGEAEIQLVAALDVLRRHEPDVDPSLLVQCLSNLAGVRLQQQKIDESAALMDELLAVQGKRLPPDHPDLLTCRANLASLRFYQGRTDEALRLNEEVLAGRLQRTPAWDVELVTLLSNIGQMTVASGGSDDAVRAVVRRMVETGAGRSAADPRTAFYFEYFANYIEDERAMVPEALALAEQAVAVRDRLQADDLPEPLRAHALHAKLLALSGRKDEAKRELDEVTRLDGAPPHKGVWTPGVIKTLEEQREAAKRVTLDIELARAWQALDRPDLAEPLLQEGIQVADIAGRRQELEGAGKLLMQLYTAAGRDAEAADLQARLDRLPPEEASASAP